MNGRDKRDKGIGVVGRRGGEHGVIMYQESVTCCNIPPPGLHQLPYTQNNASEAWLRCCFAASKLFIKKPSL